MLSIRRLGYAALLASAIFNYCPRLAAEEPSHRHFTLTHEVRWENVTLPAGKYEISYDPNGISPVLTVTRMDGPHASFMLMVGSKEVSSPKDSDALVLESAPAGQYVSALRLPESGVTLHFWLPRVAQKQLAKAVAMSSASGQ